MRVTVPQASTPTHLSRSASLFRCSSMAAALRRCSSSAAALRSLSSRAASALRRSMFSRARSYARTVGQASACVAMQARACVVQSTGQPCLGLTLRVQL